MGLSAEALLELIDTMSLLEGGMKGDELGPTSNSLEHDRICV
jgi:hypothetical protein